MKQQQKKNRVLEHLGGQPASVLEEREARRRWFRDKRRDACVTYQQLAELVGMSKSMVSKWELGLSPLPCDRMLQLDRVFKYLEEQNARKQTSVIGGTRSHSSTAPAGDEHPDNRDEDRASEEHRRDGDSSCGDHSREGTTK